MEYGCIGKKLGHSFSKEIHNTLTDYTYELCEIPEEKLDEFMKKSDFKAINVTIPYKEKVIPHLAFISDEAKQIGAVNTIINKNGVLYGYNTDFYGMKMLIEKAGIDIQNKTVAILGSGGTSKTANAVVKFLGAKAVYKVSRNAQGDFISYDGLYDISDNIEIIINTTPVGMYPDIYNSAVDVKRFKNLSGVVDAIYNPLRSKIVSDALSLGVKAVGGLYMLVAQAAAAVEKFIDTDVSEKEIERVYNSLFKSKENIVLIGMPSCGKTTVGNILAEKLNREFLDSDILIEKTEKTTISEIFKTKGEQYFRNKETEAILTLSKNNTSVISTGGGVVLNKKNIDLLKENGKVFFLDRPLEMLITTSDRPLSSNREDLEKRYNERYNLYRENADVVIDASGNIENVVNQILKVTE